MKTILWFCSRPLESAPDRRDGTWFTAMARALHRSGKVKLVTISQAKVEGVTRSDWEGIVQWILPYAPIKGDGLPSRQTLATIRAIADEVKSDLIHVWGTENYWGLLTARGMLTAPAILEIQGLKYVCAKVYDGGLTFSERVRCIGPLELLRPSRSLFAGRRRFEQWGTYEHEMLQKHRFISTQSEWVRAHIRADNPDCRVLHTGMILRSEFLEATPWTLPADGRIAAPVIFASSSGPFAYKGIHTLIRAISMLRTKYPGLTLNVAGDIMAKGIRRSGYARWLKSEAYRLGIAEHIKWLGPLDAWGIVTNLHRASAVVVPSFVETYSLALAEAMLVGVPVVASYVGAMPELAKDGESALFFPPGDEISCASQLDRILIDPSLSSHLSTNARRMGLKRNEPDATMRRQLDIYDTVLGENR